MKEFVYRKYKDLKIRLRIVKARIKRTLHPAELNGQDFFNVPVIINNRNRLIYPKALITWMEAQGYKNIFIVDNDSTYPALLEYYKTIPHKVFYLKKNAGYKALWENEIFSRFRNQWYVYTDPDVLPSEDCPPNVVEALYNVLRKYGQYEKAGVALKIDDLPDQYSGKAEVISMESAYWKKQLEKDVYNAPVDTTFALYRPYAKGIAEECPACRLGGKYTFRHMPWYENSAALSEEEKYYRRHASKDSAYWSNK